MRGQSDDVIMSKRLQGAANRGAAGPEDGAQLLFGQLGARRQTMFDDRI
jgi:hypothetical protein